LWEDEKKKKKKKIETTKKTKTKKNLQLYPLFIVCGAGFAVCGWHLSRLALRNDDVTWNKAKGDCNIDGARKSTDSKTDKVRSLAVLLGIFLTGHTF
jgi:hypothetical protein